VTVGYPQSFLYTSYIKMQTQTQQAQMETPPQTPNRYDTIVGVSLYEDNEHVETSWFTDIQMAWIWVKNQTEICTEDESFRVKPFLRCADMLDQAWSQSANNTGICIANGGEYEEEYIYVAQYYPGVDWEQLQVQGR
jgi:hypothetical protein